MKIKHLLVFSVKIVIPSDDRCTDLNGQCLNSDTETCEIGNFQSGLCDGASNRKCCLEDDYMCKNNNGFCVDHDLECGSEFGHLVKGYCDGNASSDVHSRSVLRKSFG